MSAPELVLHRSDSRRDKAADLLSQRWDGLISNDECHASLDTLKIRGAFDSDRFCGYDYEAQRWITYSPT